MTAIEVLYECRARGVKLQADGGRLRFSPPDRVPSALVAALREHKPELLAMLADPPPVVEPETHADREALRFMRTAVGWPDGRGWYDPAQAPIAAALSRSGHGCI